MKVTELPPELLPTIFSHCSRSTLAGVLRVNHYFHDAAIRVLYSTIPRLSVSTSTKCFTSLCFNDEACKFVRTLTVQWNGVFLKDEIPGHGTLRNVARFGVKRAVLSRKLLQSRLFLLRTLLKRTTNLVSLTLIVSSRDSQSDAYASAILSAKAPTSLLYFKTSFFVTVCIAAFIERQRDLKEFHLDSGAAFIEDVVVHPDACPKLERFSLSWRNQRQSVEAFIRGRPLEHFAVILCQRNALDVIATLGKAVPALPSVVFTLRDQLEEDFLERATTHLPELLQIKLSLPTLPSKGVMDSMAGFTSRSHTLHSLYLVIRGMQPQYALGRNPHLSNIVVRWVSSCPTLEVIHFPDIQGKLTKKSASYDFLQSESNGCCAGTCLTVHGRGKRTMAVVSLSRGPCTYRPIIPEDQQDLPGSKTRLLAYLSTKASTT